MFFPLTSYICTRRRFCSDTLALHQAMYHSPWTRTLALCIRNWSPASAGWLSRPAQGLPQPEPAKPAPRQFPPCYPGPNSPCQTGKPHVAVQPASRECSWPLTNPSCYSVSWAFPAGEWSPVVSVTVSRETRPQPYLIEMCRVRPPSSVPLSGLPLPPSSALPRWPSALRVGPPGRWGHSVSPCRTIRHLGMPFLHQKTLENGFCTKTWKDTRSHLYCACEYYTCRVSPYSSPINAPHAQTGCTRAMRLWVN